MNPAAAIGSLLPQAQQVKLPTSSPRAVPTKELEQLKSVAEAPAPGRAVETGGSFENMLGALVKDVGQRQAVAGEAVQGLLAGQGVSLHQAMLAMEEASVSFQLMVEVRNKLLESYQEMMRMQI